MKGVPGALRWSVLLVLGCGSMTLAAELEAGVATVDITPPRGYRMAGYYSERINTGTRDPLLAKAIVLRQGDQRAALILCDLIGIPGDIARAARARAEAASGIPATNMAVAATHSHTGPLFFGVLRTRFHEAATAREGHDPREELDYAAFLAERLADAVVKAQAALTRVQLAAGVAHETRLSFNRRFHMKDGTVRFNPGVLNPEIVRPAGPIDPDAGLLLVRDAKGAMPLAALTVFALHLDTVGGTEYSADYPFFLERALKRALGRRFVSLFAAGTCGDINHIDVTTRERATTDLIGSRLAQTVLDALPGLTVIEPAGLAVASATVDIPLQQPTAAEVDAARAKADKLGSESLPFLERVEAAKVLDLDQTYHRAKTVALEVQAFRLGPELALVTLPGEVFVELGLAIKKQSPFERTFVIELANAVPAYIPTKKAFGEGSYEIVNSRVAPGGGERLVETAVSLLRDLDRPAH